MKNILIISGCVFNTAVSIIAATHVESLFLKVLLIVSALVSLALAIGRIYSFRRIEKRIKELEDNQITTEYVAETETLRLKKGK